MTSRDNSHTVAVVGQNPNNIISYIKQKLNPKEFANQNIQENFGQSVEDLQSIFTEDIKNILAENEINSDEFEIEDVRLYGSYTTGKNKDTSDLDVIVQYKGRMKEDAAFIKCCNDGNFYVTNFHLKNGKLKQLLKNGQIVYDLSDKPAVQNAPDNNIINDNSQNFNPNVQYQSNYSC